MAHEHRWEEWLVASQTRTRMKPAALSADEDEVIVQAKTIYRCSCGELREELYEGPPEGAPQPPVPPEVEMVLARQRETTAAPSKITP